MNMEDYYKMLQEAVARNAELKAKAGSTSVNHDDDTDAAEPSASSSRR